MTRSKAREIAVHLIYASECTQTPVDELLNSAFDKERFADLAAENDAYASPADDRQKKYIRDAVTGVFEKKAELEGYIAEFSVGWSISRISRLAKAVLELAMFEALYMDDVPCNVAIHEAVLISQRYEDPETVSFANGILGAFSRKYFPSAES